MNAVDTNILARVVLQDDADQVQLAHDVLSRPVWVSNTVWVELGWLLGRRLNLDRAVVSDALALLLSGDTVHVADREGLRWAIDRYREGADWADMVHLVAARGAADRFLTFDRAMVRQCGEAPPIVVEALA